MAEEVTFQLSPERMSGSLLAGDVGERARSNIPHRYLVTVSAPQLITLEFSLNPPQPLRLDPMHSF